MLRAGPQPPGGGIIPQRQKIESGGIFVAAGFVALTGGAPVLTVGGEGTWEC